MFKKIKKVIAKKIEKRNRVSGLSKGMEIVDKYMRPGMNPKALDFSAGYAQARIHVLYENNEISKEEMEAALFSLNDQHEKLRNKALIEMIG